MPEEKTSREEREQMLQIAESVMSVLVGNFPNEDRAEIESCTLEGIRRAHEKKIEWEVASSYVHEVAKRRLFDVMRKRFAVKRNPESAEQLREALFGKLNGLDMAEYSQFLNGGYRDEIVVITEGVRKKCSDRMKMILDISLENVPQTLSNEEMRLELASRGIRVSESTVRTDRNELRRLGREAFRLYGNEGKSGSENSTVA